MENFRHAFSIHYPYWGGFWGWGRGAKPGTINLRGLCHFCPKKWSNFPSTKKISFVLLNITIVQLIITHINLGGAPWNGTFGFFEQCEKSIPWIFDQELFVKSNPFSVFAMKIKILQISFQNYLIWSFPYEEVVKNISSD